MEDIIQIVISNGVFACLFVWLLFYQLKDSSTREKKYIEIINKLSKQLEIIEDVKEDIKEIKTKVETITKRKVHEPKKANKNV